MGIFNRNQSPEDEAKRAEEERAEEERIKALAENIYDDHKNTVLAYDKNTLILEHKRHHDEFALDGKSTLVTYTNEDRLMGTHEIGIWEKDLKERNAGTHPSYKKVGGIGFTKKEADTFFHLYHDVRNNLEGKALFYTPEQEFSEICFDDTDQILEFADGRRTYFIEYCDIIGADLNTNTKTLTTTKSHVGKTKVSTADEEGINGAEGDQDVSSTTTIESYDIVIYQNDSEFLLLKKHFEAKEGSDVQQIYALLTKIVEANEH